MYLLELQSEPLVAALDTPVEEKAFSYTYVQWGRWALGLLKLGYQEPLLLLCKALHLWLVRNYILSGPLLLYIV